MGKRCQAGSGGATPDPGSSRSLSLSHTGQQQGLGRLTPLQPANTIFPLYATPPSSPSGPVPTLPRARGASGLTSRSAEGDVGLLLCRWELGS